MKISNQSQCYVWIWLPNATKPMICGKIVRRDDKHEYYYAPSYVDYANAIKLSTNMSLTAERLIPDHNLHGVFRDALPDAWGQRVLFHRYKTLFMSPIEMLLHSSSDRIGALHFQTGRDSYQPHFEDNATLEQLLEAAYLVEQGQPLPPALDLALAHGTSVGGARPKALIESHHKKYIAKFSSSTDLYTIVQAEYAAMWLAKKVGLNVASSEIHLVSGKHVLRIEWL